MMVGEETWWIFFVTLGNFFFEVEIEARWLWYLAYCRLAGVCIHDTRVRGMRGTNSCPDTCTCTPHDSYSTTLTCNQPASQPATYIPLDGYIQHMCLGCGLWTDR